MIKIKQVYFELTNECNFFCKHCQNNSGNRGGRDLDYEAIKRIVTECRRYGLERVSLSGGEPTLYTEFRSLISFLFNEGINVNVLTNGFLIDRYIDTLVRYRDRVFVQVSLDGYDRETFYAIRNNYKFDSIVNNIKTLRSKGIGVHIKTTITKDNLASYERYASLAKDLDCSIAFNFLNPVGRAKEMSNACLDLYEMRNFVESLENDERLLFPPVESFMPTDCSLLSNDDVFNILKINSVGEVYSCTGLRDKEFSLGNIYDDDFSIIISRKAELKNYIKKRLLDKDCKKCRFDKDCNKCCVAFCEYNYHVG